MSLEKKIKIAKSASNKWYFIKKNLVSKHGEGWKYYKYRIFRPLLKIYFRLFRLIYYPAPWISPASAYILRKILNKNMTGFEYGSGVSTVFLSKYLRSLTSIEHYPLWYEKVRNLLLKKDIQNVNLILAKPLLKRELPTNPTKDEIKDIMYGSTYYDYNEYVKQVNALPDNSLDFLLIDGRERVKCLEKAISKVKQNGIIVLDNSERDKYKKAFELLSQYPSIFTTTGLTDTTIWFKPH